VGAIIRIGWVRGVAAIAPSTSAGNCAGDQSGGHREATEDMRKPAFLHHTLLFYKYRLVVHMVLVLDIEGFETRLS
jgi:hypothetical protein